MYFVDIARRHNHPHTWVFNSPFFIAWIMDYIYGSYYKYERVCAEIIDLGPDYMLITW